MKISERQKTFLKALRTAFGDTEITTRAINVRLAGGALNDPANAAMLQAIVGCVGRKVHSTGIGKLLEKVRGRRIGNLELVCDGDGKRNGIWHYFIKDHTAPITPVPDLEQIKKEAEANSEAWVDKMMALAPNKRVRDIEAQFRREERAKLKEQAEADHAKVMSDPATAAIYLAVKCGRDGRPEPVEDLPPIIAGTVSVTPAAPAKETTWFPGCGRQPTKGDLAARHQQYTKSTLPVGSVSVGSPEWFAAACRLRNRG